MSIETAVDRIWGDLTDRKGVKHELLSCDEEIQQEIKETIANIIETETGYQSQSILYNWKAREVGEVMRGGDMILLGGRFVKLGFDTDFEHLYAGKVVPEHMGNGVFYDSDTQSLRQKKDYQNEMV